MIRIGKSRVDLPRIPVHPHRIPRTGRRGGHNQRIGLDGPGNAHPRGVRSVAFRQGLDGTGFRFRGNKHRLNCRGGPQGKLKGFPVEPQGHRISPGLPARAYGNGRFLYLRRPLHCGAGEAYVEARLAPAFNSRQEARGRARDLQAIQTQTIAVGSRGNVPGSGIAYLQGEIVVFSHVQFAHVHAGFGFDRGLKTEAFTDIKSAHVLIRRLRAYQNRGLSGYGIVIGIHEPNLIVVPWDAVGHGKGAVVPGG